MKRVRSLSVLGAVVLLLAACGPAAQQATPTTRPAEAAPAATKVPMPSTVEFATHSVGTVFNAVGSGLAKVATEHLPGTTVVVTPTSGPPAWVPTMNNEGRPAVAIINVFDIWQAYSGKVFPKPPPAGTPDLQSRYQPNQNLRLLMMGTRMSACVLVKNDSPIRTLADLKGKRFSWDFPAFPPNIHAGLAMLATGGMSVSDTTTVSITEVVAGVRALMEGRVEATITAIGMPIVSEADAAIGVRCLPAGTDSERVKAAQAMMPGGSVTPLKPGPAGVKEEIPAWNYPITVVSSTHLPDDVAYTLVKTWWENYQELWPIHAQLKGWAPELFVQNVATIPYHPGAIKFYKEKGIWTAAMDQMQARLLKGELPFLE